MTSGQSEGRSDGLEVSALNVALTAMAAFQGYVQQADSKVNTLLVVHSGGIVVVLGALAGRAVPDGMVLPMLLLLGGFAVALVMSGRHVFRALSPGVEAPAVPSRFAITGIGATGPDLATGLDPADLDPVAQCAEAWAMSRLLARTALVKNHHIARAMPWTAAMLAFGVAAALLRSW
jgi:hypothetical protein